MKNVKIALTVLFLSVSFFGFSQKIKLKKGDILVDETPWMKYNDCGTFDNVCSIVNSAGDEVIYIKFNHLDGEAPSTQSNPRGTLSYSEVKFLGLNASVEFEGRTTKKIIEMIYAAKLIDDSGQLNEDNVQRFVEKHGTPVSSRLNRTTNSNNTVIIREEPRSGSGVNVHIGR